jgi:phosphatidate cytidylyltransferase
MLKQRVITAIVLLGVLLPALFAPVAWPFAILNGMSSAVAVLLGVGLASVCGAALWAGWSGAAPAAAWWLATAVWVLGGAWALHVGPSGWPALSQTLRAGLGLIGLWTAWLALANAKAAGINYILSIFCLVWAADIAAYFGGRTFGRRKLAPGISPGKSWEGVWSGMAGVLLLAALWLVLDRAFAFDSASLYTRLASRLGMVGMAVALLFLAGMSVVGDLVESLVKRSAGAKDSSRLLPGHGGVLDRIDALLPVFPLALAISSL